MITAKEATASSWVITPEGLKYNYEDSIDKPRSGNPMVRSLIFIDSKIESDSTLRFVRKSGTALSITFIARHPFKHSKLDELQPDEYDIYLDTYLLQKDVPFKLGGVYTVVGSNVLNNNITGNTITVTEPNSMHMMWLLPQYIIITMGEVMFSVTGLQFAFTQAPESMKSILTAGWLLTVAFGNLIVVIVAEVSFFSRQVSNEIWICGC